MVDWPFSFFSEGMGHVGGASMREVDCHSDSRFCSQIT